jgi:hypothetical protein
MAVVARSGQAATPCYHRRMTAPSASGRARVRLLAAAGALALAPWRVATAQAVRQIPDGVELGRLRIGVFPEATLDGRPVQLGPGTRILDADGRIVPPASVGGERRVAYLRGTLGEVTQVWLLSDDEYRTIAARIAAQRRAATQR